MPIDVLPRGPRRPARLVLAAFVLAGLIVLPAAAQDRSTQREQFRSAYAAAQRTPPGEWKKLAVGLDDYPLYPYLEATVLRRTIAKASRADIEHFLKRWPDSLPESDVRDAYLRELARRGEWSTFRAFWKASRDRDLQCDALAARVAAGEKLDYAKDIEPLWTNPRSLPGACDSVLANARVNGVLIDALVWTRLLEAAGSGNEDSAAAAAAMFSGADKDAADRIVAAVRNPSVVLAKSDQWPDTPRNRDAIAYGLARYARRDSASTETLWAKLGDKFKWDDPQKNRVLNALAVYRSTSYSPDALARLKALPERRRRRHEPRMARAHRTRNRRLQGNARRARRSLRDAAGRFALEVSARARLDETRSQDRRRADLRRRRARSELPRLPRRRLDRRAVRDLPAHACD